MSLTHCLYICFLVSTKRFILTCITYAAYYSAHQHSLVLWYALHRPRHSSHHPGSTTVDITDVTIL